ncbi:MAG: exodeoxyribonuclease VII large subunit, partial [Anaeroplasmataceae bacterium]|nr:exodeoxyribonuclease VII large subunit [Anaeroplasmataceae bacterium]
MEERYLTVTALTKYIKYKFDHDHHLEEVLLEGEISNFKHNSRGHFYFTLKDENASISVTMFSSFARLVKFEPKDGMKVFVKGNVTVYEPSGTYQINIREMKSDGVGDLYLAFQKLKAELEKEGLFDASHKQKLPLFPQCIGVVTSPTGAAIKDIIHTVGRRYPLTRIILYPAIVQGDDAKDNVVKQIELANEQGLCDVLIVGRGGGSIEDLWAFNERCVAMAIYNSKIPIISAVGHEIDFTIADFVADVRAATPTAAAELATPSLEMLKGNVSYYVDRMTKHMKQILQNARLHIANMDRRIDALNPMSMLEH